MNLEQRETCENTGSNNKDAIAMAQGQQSGSST
jgi:hypothetical protein